MPIIEVDHLTKEYRLGAMQGLKQTLLNTAARLAGRPVQERRPLFKALDDVSFSIEQGEVVGIIGHNGAGKSTLLKMLARISTPTRGSIKVQGRVAPLIEVGAGFVPDFTGRENVYLNGAILGMSHQEIDRKFDEIVDFAEMSEFIDTPVKRYSSGMQVKLAFAVATSIEAEILIVDEVLAVGDLAFQRKCFDRMEDLIKRRGKTVLVVSHNIRQIERMCRRVILLDHGKIQADGDPHEVCGRFYELSNAKVQAGYLTASHEARIASSGELELLSVEIVDRQGVPIGSIASGDPLRIRIRFKLHKSLTRPEIVVGTHTTDFVYLTAGSTASFPDRPDYSSGMHELVHIVESFPLVAGVYSVRFSMFDENRRPVFTGEMLKSFSVMESGKAHESGWWSLNLPTTWILDDRRFPGGGHPETELLSSP